jgi:hypothetical protein
MSFFLLSIFINSRCHESHKTSLLPLQAHKKRKILKERKNSFLLCPFTKNLTLLAEYIPDLCDINNRLWRYKNLLLRTVNTNLKLGLYRCTLPPLWHHRQLAPSQTSLPGQPTSNITTPQGNLRDLHNTERMEVADTRHP